MYTLNKTGKKYNNATGGYKVDIFINGTYYCSTDWYKTCKAAKVNVQKKFPNDKVTAKFFHKW